MLWLSAGPWGAPERPRPISTAAAAARTRAPKLPSNIGGPLLPGLAGRIPHTGGTVTGQSLRQTFPQEFRVLSGAVDQAEFVSYSDVSARYSLYPDQDAILPWSRLRRN